MPCVICGKQTRDEMSSKSLLTIAATVGPVMAAMHDPTLGQTPAQDGQWTAPFNLPLIAIHSAVLPTGKVPMFSAEHGVPGIHGWLFDPASVPGTPALTNVPPPARQISAAMADSRLQAARPWHRAGAAGHFSIKTQDISQFAEESDKPVHPINRMRGCDVDSLAATIDLASTNAVSNSAFSDVLPSRFLDKAS